MIDSHCHLTAPEFSNDVSEVLVRATAAGVATFITISDEMADLPKCMKLAQVNENVFYTVGVHPHHAKDFDIPRDCELLRLASASVKCRGIGEIGLDYHYMHSPKDTQQRVFEAQLVLAKELDLPAIVHCRDAVEDVWTIVHHVKPRKLVIHCCTEKWHDVEKFVKAGYMLSFTGIVTYPKATDIHETVKQCPLESMMVETDAPFLAPIPYRGKRCEPAFVMDTAKVIADLKGLALKNFDAATTQAAKAFFGV